MRITPKKRILLCSFTFYPARNGVANAVFKAARGLAERGYEITVATSGPRSDLGEVRDYEYLKKIGISVHEFDVRKVRHRKYAGEIKKYQNFLNRNTCDVIISYGFPNWNSDLLLKVREHIRAKLVLYSHGFSGNIFYSFRNIKSYLVWRHYVFKLPSILKCADHLVFLKHKPDRDRFYDLYLAQKLGLDYSVIGNGSDLVGCRIHPNDFTEKHHIRTKYLILNVSGYSYLKNPFGALKAFHGSGVQDATLVIAGIKKGPYGKDLQRYIRAKGVRNVILLENPGKSDLMKAYGASDLFLCTSKTESYGQVVLDAVVCGVPFISTLKIMDEFKGGIVVSNISEMAKQIQSLMINDGLLMKLRRELTPEYLSNFRWDRITDQYEAMIASLWK